jgi:hypothetical protein
LFESGQDDFAPLTVGKREMLWAEPLLERSIEWRATSRSGEVMGAIGERPRPGRTVAQHLE